MGSGLFGNRTLLAFDPLLWLLLAGPLVIPASFTAYYAPEKAADTQALPTTAGAESNNEASHTQLYVNGESVSLPKNGALRSTIQNNNGQTSVSINANTQQTTNSYSSNVTIDISNTPGNQSSLFYEEHTVE